MAERPYRLPANVRADIHRIWGWKTPDRSHAAKQAVCDVAANLFFLDRNAVVDVAISAGRLAEQMRDQDAESFIHAFEEKIINSSVPTSEHGL